TLYALHHRTEASTLYSLARLVKIDWPDTAGRPKFVTAYLDRSVTDIAISPDSKRVYITAEEYCHDKLFTVPAPGGTPAPVVEVKDGGYTNLAIPKRAARTVLVALWGSMTHPEDVVTIDPDKHDRRFLSAFNKDRVERIDWQPP